MTFDSIRRMAAVAGIVLALSACDSGSGNDPDAGVGDASPPLEACSDPCCLSLFGCCSLVLVNPVFAESCNQVVRQCDPVRCADLLAGYTECRPLFGDGGIDPSVCDDLTAAP